MTIPRNISEVNTKDRKTLQAFARENNYGFNMEDDHCDCGTCQHVLDKWHEENDKRIATAESVLESIMRVAELSLADGFAAGVASVQVDEYEMYLDAGRGEDIFLSGHRDPFWLMSKARHMQIVLEGMTPNIVFRVERVGPTFSENVPVAEVREGGLIVLR